MLKFQKLESSSIENVLEPIDVQNANIENKISPKKEFILSKINFVYRVPSLLDGS